MASFSISMILFLTILQSLVLISHQQPILSSSEQDSVYQVLESINSAILWRTLFPDDLCSSAPHGVVCDFFFQSPNSTEPDSVHITELSFGFVSDYSPNPPCSSNSTLSPLVFSSFNFLRKLFFYKCFTHTPVSFPPDIPPRFGSTLEELVFVDNPSLVGPLSDILRKFPNLMRVVLTGNGVYGTIPNGVTDLVNLEEITLSRNQLSGQVPVNIAKLEKLKILDLSGNVLNGNIPESVGNISGLLKLDWSYNGFSGKIPESFRNLKRLEFLDLSYNRLGNFGIPLFLSEMGRLREVYLSGNPLGGQIPQKWEKLGGVSGIGFSGMGLVGRIPASMGIYLKNLTYLGLDNNKLEGKVPEEFGLLELVNEINLENNNLSGKIPFSAKLSDKMGKKLRLEGNPELCIDEEGWRSVVPSKGTMGKMRVCKNKPDIPNPAILNGCSSLEVVFIPQLVFLLGVLLGF